MGEVAETRRCVIGAPARQAEDGMAALEIGQADGASHASLLQQPRLAITELAARRTLECYHCSSVNVQHWQLAVGGADAVPICAHILVYDALDVGRRQARDAIHWMRAHAVGESELDRRSLRLPGPTPVHQDRAETAVRVLKASLQALSGHEPGDIVSQHGRRR